MHKHHFIRGFFTKSWFCKQSDCSIMWSNKKGLWWASRQGSWRYNRDTQQWYYDGGDMGAIAGIAIYTRGKVDYE